jgi:cytosine/adenosine deaminase-related metal-dependent hydrolase
MTYRKFKADYLFLGDRMASPDSVLITTGEGIVQEIVPGSEAGEDAEVYSGVLSPGFVNCHCHLELSHLKGVIREGTGLVDFLSTVIRRRGEAAKAAGAGGGSEQGERTREQSPFEGTGDIRSGSPVRKDAEVSADTRSGSLARGLGERVEEKIREAIAAGEQEMLDNGIVAVGDICNTADTVAQKALGRLYYHNFIETMGFIEEGAAVRFGHSLTVFNAFAEAYQLPIESNSIVPHAPYSVSGALFRLIAGFPGNHLLTIHNQESEAENEWLLSGKGDFLRLYQLLGLDVSFFKGTGKRSPESFLPYFYRNQSLILVHNVATGAEDVQAAVGGTWSERPFEKRTREGAPGGPDLYFCLCPNANLYIGGQLPDVELLHRQGCRIVIGTDSLASNHQLSILEELKTLQRAFPGLSTPTLLQWATAGGAEALQLERVLGTFAAGKQPGIVLIEGGEGDRLTAGANVRRLL